MLFSPSTKFKIKKTYSIQRCQTMNILFHIR
nr:MAG TPA: hypothetical protein [Caudoviricetes sp.]